MIMLAHKRMLPSMSIISFLCMYVLTVLTLSGSYSQSVNLQKSQIAMSELVRIIARKLDSPIFAGIGDDRIINMPKGISTITECLKQLRIQGHYEIERKGNKPLLIIPVNGRYRLIAALPVPLKWIHQGKLLIEMLNAEQIEQLLHWQPIPVKAFNADARTALEQLMGDLLRMALRTEEERRWLSEAQLIVSVQPILSLRLSVGGKEINCRITVDISNELERYSMKELLRGNGYGEGGEDVGRDVDAGMKGYEWVKVAIENDRHTIGIHLSEPMGMIMGADMEGEGIVSKEVGVGKRVRIGSDGKLMKVRELCEWLGEVGGIELSFDRRYGDERVFIANVEGDVIWVASYGARVVGLELRKVANQWHMGLPRRRKGRVREGKELFECEASLMRMLMPLIRNEAGLDERLGIIPLDWMTGFRKLRLKDAPKEVKECVEDELMRRGIKVKQGEIEEAMLIVHCGFNFSLIWLEELRERLQRVREQSKGLRPRYRARRELPKSISVYF